MRLPYMRKVNRGLSRMACRESALSNPERRVIIRLRSETRQDFIAPNETDTRTHSKILASAAQKFGRLTRRGAMSSYDKVRGGSLSFKNGGSLAVKKKKKKKDKRASDEALELALEERRVGEGIGGAPGGDAKSDYEDLFPAEKKRQADAKGRSNCWGTNYREAPDVLHGYTESWKGKKSFSAEERLDLRAASKADKFCR